MLTVGHSSIQQPSMYTRNATRAIYTDPTDPVITEGQMYPQAYNQAVMFGQDKRVDPRSLYSPYTLPGADTNPQLTSSKSVHPSNTSRARVVPPNMGASYIGAADNTASCSVSFQSSSISDPNNVSSLYRHSTHPAAAPVQLADENVNRTNSPLHTTLSLPLSLPLSLLRLPPPLVSILYLFLTHIGSYDCSGIRYPQINFIS